MTLELKFDKKFDFEEDLGLRNVSGVMTNMPRDGSSLVWLGINNPNGNCFLYQVDHDSGEVCSSFDTGSSVIYDFSKYHGGFFVVENQYGFEMGSNKKPKKRSINVSEGLAGCVLDIEMVNGTLYGLAKVEPARLVNLDADQHPRVISHIPHDAGFSDSYNSLVAGIVGVQKDDNFFIAVQAKEYDDYYREFVQRLILCYDLSGKLINKTKLYGYTTPLIGSVDGLVYIHEKDYTFLVVDPLKGEYVERLVLPESDVPERCNSNLEAFSFAEKDLLIVRRLRDLRHSKYELVRFKREQVD